MGRTRFFLIAVVAAGATSIPAGAQVLSNATLNGSYYFRYLGAFVGQNVTARSFLGAITFDGNGNYSLTGQCASGAVGGCRVRSSGTYYVGPGGMFYMSHPDANATADTLLYGGVGVGNVITGSSTDTDYCDTMVAFPASTAASNGTLSGNYHVGHLEFLDGNLSTQVRNTFFPMTSDGSGSLGNVTIRGFAQNLQNAATTQTSTGATYTVNANGSGTLNLPAPGGQSAANTLLAGNKTLYVSSDGNVFMAANPAGFDMVIGVKAHSGSPDNVLSGLYFTTQFDHYGSSIYGAQGASTLISSNRELAHQRIQDAQFFGYDSTYNSAFTFSADGTVTFDSYGSYGLGTGGNFTIGAGDKTNYQLNLYVKAAAVSGSGVFINPQAIVNAASNIPFTAQVAPGEFVTLYGSGLSGQTAVADTLPFPTLLGGVQVTVNGTPAPIYYVSPTQISLVVPYATPNDGSLIRFQVTNGGTASNIAEVYSGVTSPGIYTLPPGGIGAGAILKADFSVVSEANPARPGDTVQVYLTGLGRVDQNVAAGAAGPADPLARTQAEVAVFINGLAATVDYSGLAPGLAGLYQLNVRIPANAPAGDVPIQIETADAANFQATIRIAR